MTIQLHVEAQCVWEVEEDRPPPASAVWSPGLGNNPPQLAGGKGRCHQDLGRGASYRGRCSCAGHRYNQGNGGSFTCVVGGGSRDASATASLSCAFPIVLLQGKSAIASQGTAPAPSNPTHVLVFIFLVSLFPFVP